jgi:hypothetical protein
MTYRTATTATINDRAKRQSARLARSSLEPINNHSKATFLGMSVIRAFGKEAFFKEEFRRT